MSYMRTFYRKYKHLFPLAVFLIFYLTVFVYVENRPAYHMHLLASRFDHLIPFCELFVVLLYHVRCSVFRNCGEGSGSVLSAFYESDDRDGSVPADFPDLAKWTHTAAGSSSKGQCLYQTGDHDLFLGYFYECISEYSCI